MSTVTISYENLSEEQIYIDILKKFENLFPDTDYIISVISNFTALLKQSFGKISWVGFYFVNGEYLYLGPFQGKVACTQIRIGNGVCGTSAKEKKTIIVENVNKFLGHIACDSDSRSEIVVPIIDKDNLIGVLDVDSYRYSAFNNTDQFYLEKLTSLLAPRLNNIIKQN